MSVASRPFKISEASPAAAGTAASAGVIGGLATFDTIAIVATLLGAANGTLDVYLVDSFDGGTTWLEYARFTQVAASAATKTYVIDPVLTGSITAVTRNATATSAIGTLAANAIRPGKWGDFMKAIFVAGAGTTAGATQTIEVFGSNTRR
jgi:hypothetical protein